MTVSATTKRRFALATALRGVFMLLAGLYAVIWPAEALTVLVLAGGILLLVDGALGLWSLTFGGGKSGNYWFDVVANALSLVLGVLILLSPLLATILTVTLLVTLVGPERTDRLLRRFEYRRYGKELCCLTLMATGLAI